VSTQIRPTGVTILAILEIISGILAIVFGTFFGVISSASLGTSLFDGAAPIAVGLVSGVLVSIGIVSFVMAWGLLKGKSWAWTITLILTIISLIFDLPSMNIIGLIIDIVILYYLFRPHVKAYFGKANNDCKLIELKWI
jgi:hypothetical protein